jgi:CheY-like chemotaxis protein
VSFDLGGEAELYFDAEGLRARFLIPGHHLHAVAETQIEAVAGLVAPQPLARLMVLLVEDQALIAMDTEEILRDLGAIDVTSRPNVALALEALRDQRPDCAVLDLNLGLETSEAVAIELGTRGVPFVFATGYRDSVSIPSGFATVPVVRKPVSHDMLARQLTQALTDRRGDTA